MVLLSIVLSAIAYVSDGTSDQVLDLYWPASVPSATVLFIHGGSLQESGERRDSPPYRDVCKPFVEASIACATMDYRLAPRNRWPAMPNDVASAVVRLRALIKERGGDPQRLFLFGHSSGCHLAAIVSTNTAYLAAVGLKPSDLAGIIAMGCTLDREDVAIRQIPIERIRAALSHDPVDTATYGTAENWLAANPASFIGPHVPPTLVVVAENERFFPAILEQGARFVRQLLEQKVRADLVIVPGRHMSSIAAIGQPNDPTFRAIRAFIDQR
jgi:acetyl esterase/lipase